MICPRLVSLSDSLLFVALVSACCPGSAHPDADAGAQDGGTSCELRSRGARLFATTTDYASGSIAMIGQPDLCTSASIAPASGDTVLSWHGALLVALNYDANRGDSLSFFDVSVAPPLLVRQLPAQLDGETGGSDPRGYVRIDDDRGYVSRWLRPSLAIADLRGGAPVATIDLAPFRGRATLPFPRHMLRVGGNVWVTLERLYPDLQHSIEPGAVVVIDAARDAVLDTDSSRDGVQAIELHRANPVGRPSLRANGGAIFVSVGSYFDATDGAVEEVDAATFAWRRELVTELQVHGNIDAAIPLDEDRLLLRVVSEAHGTGVAVDQSQLIEWSVSAQAPVRSPWLTVAQYTLTEPVLGRDGRVYIGDRGDEVTRRPHGIRVFEAATGREITTAPIAVGAMPPYDLAEEPLAP